jgi:glycosyltransferase involved in cell wall biosynthesis
VSRPTRGRIVTLEHGAGPIAVPAGELAYVLFRRDGRVVSRLVVEGPATVSEPDASIAPPSPPVLPASAVSIVIATRDRPEELAACLAALRAHASDALEVIVCDSASSDAGAVRLAAARGAASLVRCERPGLSLARNTGAGGARAEVVAFLDDDCRVEPGWLAGIRGGFEDERVAAVTGSYIPAELDHEAQLLFLRYAHMDRRGLERRRFSLGSRESLHWPLDAWRMGSGGNLAVRADALRRAGGFRLDLGLGTPGQGGEDLFLLWSIVRDGADVVYRPDAMVSHRHHRDVASLHRVLSGYGSGHAAYLAAARTSGASRLRTSLYAASVLYDRGKRAAGALLTGDLARLALVGRETHGLLFGGRA